MNPQTSKSQLTIGGLFCYTYIDRKEINRKMSKRKSKKEKILVMTSLETTRAAMPKFDPACRCGKHKSKKDYDRKDKSWKNEEWY